MTELTVDLKGRAYPIHIAEGAIALLGPELRRLKATSVLVVTNTTVGALYEKAALESIRAAAPDLPVSVVTLPDGECYKDLMHIEKILAAAVDAGLDRKSYMVALGGGVIGDMTGFAASMWMRGIDFIQVPTTLLAQVDSSVGGKTGVNLPAGKNLIGAFHQPRSVIADTALLRTLPAREVSAGIAEIIKYGLLGDADFFSYLEKNMQALRALDAGVLEETVAHCCTMKKEIVREDERESGVRAKLNLGHTFGHAVEKLTGYSAWLHGEAVAAGYVMAAMLSQELGYLTEADVERIRAVTQAAGLPTCIPGLSEQAAVRAMAGDKKSIGGVVRFILMRRIGESFIDEAPDDKVRSVMSRSGWY